MSGKIIKKISLLLFYPVLAKISTICATIQSLAAYEVFGKHALYNAPLMKIYR